MTEGQERFARRAVRRRPVFLALSVAGVAAAVALAGFYAFHWWRDPAYPIGPRAVIVVLILLNARQNLRQYRLAAVLEPLLPAARP
jgi:hypothetical protein